MNSLAQMIQDGNYRSQQRARKLLGCAAYLFKSEGYGRPCVIWHRGRYPRSGSIFHHFKTRKKFSLLWKNVPVHHGENGIRMKMGPLSARKAWFFDSLRVGIDPGGNGRCYVAKLVYEWPVCQNPILNSKMKLWMDLAAVGVEPDADPFTGAWVGQSLVQTGRMAQVTG